MCTYVHTKPWGDNVMVDQTRDVPRDATCYPNHRIVIVHGALELYQDLFIMLCHNFYSAKVALK